MKYTIFVLIYLWFVIVDSNSLSKSSSSFSSSDIGSSTAVERVKNPWKSFNMKASLIPLQRGGFNNNRKVPTMSLNNNTPDNNLIAEILER